MTERIASRGAASGNGRTPKTIDQWSVAITASWQKAVASIIETGRLLIEAKAALRYGAWGEMVETLPFSQRTANYLMDIARHPVLSDSQFIANLPPSWGTLADLAMLPDEAVKELITAGKINADMTRDDATEIIKAHREEGLYLFERAFESMNNLVKFMRKWPDASDFAGRAFSDMEESDTAPDLDDLPKVSRWLADVHAALVAEREKEERAFQDAEEAECEEIDARVKAMTDAALKSLLDNADTPPTERSRARAEARRRDLAWHSQSVLPPKGRKKTRAGPQAEASPADDVIVRDGRTCFREPRVYDPYGDADPANEDAPPPSR